MWFHAELVVVAELLLLGFGQRVSSFSASVTPAWVAEPNCWCLRALW